MRALHAVPKIAKVPVPQDFLPDRESRFTLAFRTMITIAHKRESKVAAITLTLAVLSALDRYRRGKGGRTAKNRFQQKSVDRSAGAECAGYWNEGVGEHVRTRFHPGTLGPVEIAEHDRDPHRTKKTCFFCRTGSRKGRPLSKRRSSRLT